MLAIGALPLSGHAAGYLHDADGGQSSLLVVAMLLAFVAVGGVLLARAVRRAMWSTRVVLGPEHVEIDHGGSRAPVTLGRVDSVSVEVVMWSGSRALDSTVVGRDASGARRVILDLLSPSEADHVGAVLADHLLLARPTLVADIPRPPQGE